MAYTSISLGQFRTQLEERLGAGATTFWRTDEKNKTIVEALRFWQLLTGYWRTRVTIQTTPGAVWYSLPGTITSNMRVSWQGFPLSLSSAFELDYGRPNWESETTVSGNDVPPRPAIWVVASLNQIGLWPADAGTNQLVVDGLASTPTPVQDSDKIDLGLDELKVLLDYCQHTLAFKEAGREFEASQELFKRFLKAAGERSSILKQSAVYRKWLGLDRARFQRKVLAPDEQEAGAR